MSRETKRMGRPPIGDAAATTLIRVRVTKDEAERLTQVARENGTNRSAFIRDAVDEAVADYSERRVFRR